TSSGELRARNQICFAQGIQAFLGNLTDNANTQTRAWERLTSNNFFWQSQLAADSADLVLKQQPQWLDQFEVHIIRQSADTVVGFNIRGAIAAAGFHRVGVQGALDQEIDGGTFRGFFQSLRYSALKRADELRTNRLALSLRVNHAGQLGQESIRFMRR